MNSVYERRVWSVVGRRGRAEIERLAGLYRTSGMGRSEFCRSHGMAVSTLNRHLKKQQNRQNQAGNSGIGQSRLVAVELASAVATVPSAAGASLPFTDSDVSAVAKSTRSTVPFESQPDSTSFTSDRVITVTPVWRKPPTLPSGLCEWMAARNYV